MKVDGTDLSLTRGDSASLVVEPKIDGDVYYLTDGDVLHFTVRKHARAKEIEVQKIITEFVGGKALIEVEPDDTKHMHFATYRYDLQLTKSDGTVTTIVKPSRFKVMEAITYD